ncbi:hypothetical protein HaLaN_19797 [Haematococcus lacustris]|uniref:Uncharacterized protein n=1 Tax=Haematococcus lacustris TaxID=44745 RepID=A0A699ZK05_HAELA|nr:hypothetical protein HaLaN_19797 [Haematococcus lacustris]
MSDALEAELARLRQQVDLAKAALDKQQSALAAHSARVLTSLMDREQLVAQLEERQAALQATHKTALP